MEDQTGKNYLSQLRFNTVSLLSLTPSFSFKTKVECR